MTMTTWSRWIRSSAVGYSGEISSRKIKYEKSTQKNSMHVCSDTPTSNWPQLSAELNNPSACSPSWCRCPLSTGSTKPNCWKLRLELKCINIPLKWHASHISQHKPPPHLIVNTSVLVSLRHLQVTQFICVCCYTPSHTLHSTINFSFTIHNSPLLLVCVSWTTIGQPENSVFFYLSIYLSI